ncbi:MAG: hypothetical protein H7326_04825, partial [Bdellovibrionaceae bacterium]|nr:hypothetical protein [Pseudobdellovibrionaceae bacterium]
MSVSKVFAVGLDEQLCIDSANARVKKLTGHTVRTCERKAEGFFTCAISEQKVSEAPGPILGVVGKGDYNHSSGDETKCRTSVIKTAEANAVELCKAKFGVDCTVTKRGEATFELKKKRYICAAT